MIKRGAEYLAGLRDGRIVYIGGERVDDVTVHPGFRNAARSYAAIYDARFNERYRDILVTTEDAIASPPISFDRKPAPISNVAPAHAK